MKVGDFVYLFRGDEYVYGWGGITKLSQPKTTGEGLRREVTVIQSFLQSQLVSVADLRQREAFAHYDRLKNYNLSSFDEDQARYLNTRFPGGQSPPDPEDVQEQELLTPRFRPALTGFVLGQRVSIDETRFDEFKTTTSPNPVNAILNEIDDYIIAYLNLEDRRGEHHCRIFWGVQDRPHTVVGITLNDKQRD